MTQPPPTGPYEQPPALPHGAATAVGPAPYSAAAIAALVLSLLGCLGFTAVLGLIFGVVGIVKTRGGVRRGAGLAIAAIPISIVTGLMSVAALMLFGALGNAMLVAMTLPDMYDVDGNVSAESLATFRGACTESFNAEVTADQLTAWFQSARAEHGALIELIPGGQPNSIPGTDRLVYPIRGKFVSGIQDIEITLRILPPISIKIDDITIAASSPRPSH